VDLAKMWKELGIREEGGKIVFDDAAPLAGVRKAITRRLPNPVTDRHKYGGNAGKM